jgi:hypothetical protein
MGDYARLAAGATRIRGAGHEETGGDEENQDVDNSASAWLQPGELAIVVYVRGRRADVVARRIGDRNTRTYAPGALEPAPPPPQLAVGDRVVLSLITEARCLVWHAAQPWSLSTSER